MSNDLAFWIAFAVGAVCAVGLGWCVAWASKDRRASAEVWSDPDRDYRVTRLHADFIRSTKGESE